MYASDLADRLEYQIIPALKSGFIVLADRYIYTAIARGVARAADRDWLMDHLRFCALKPDLVIFYLQIGVKELVPRVLEAGKMNYWESGLDMNYGDDLYDSFVAYQSELIEQFNAMAEEFQFTTLDARLEANVLQRKLREAVGEYLRKTDAHSPDVISTRTPIA